MKHKTFYVMTFTAFLSSHFEKERCFHQMQTDVELRVTKIIIVQIPDLRALIPLVKIISE